MSMRAVHEPHCATHRFGGGPCDCGVYLDERSPEAKALDALKARDAKNVTLLRSALEGVRAARLEIDALQSKLDAVSGERAAACESWETWRNKCIDMEKERDAALAEVAALKADRDNWIAAAQGLGKANDAALARAGRMEADIKHLRALAAYGIDNISADPLAGYRHICEACDKTLATPANGGEANG